MSSYHSDNYSSITKLDVLPSSKPNIGSLSSWGAITKGYYTHAWTLCGLFFSTCWDTGSTHPVNHRITEYPKLQGTNKGHRVQSLAPYSYDYSNHRVPSVAISLILYHAFWKQHQMPIAWPATSRSEKAHFSHSLLTKKEKKNSITTYSLKKKKKSNKPSCHSKLKFCDAQKTQELRSFAHIELAKHSVIKTLVLTHILFALFICTFICQYHGQCCHPAC